MIVDALTIDATIDGIENDQAYPTVLTSEPGWLL